MGDVLPAAVPDYQHDPAEACRALGRAYLYIAQLQALLTERAAEANRLHNDLLAAQARVADLEASPRSPAGEVDRPHTGEE